MEQNTRVFEQPLNSQKELLFLQYHHNSDIVSPTCFYKKECSDKDIDKKKYDLGKTYMEMMYDAFEPRSQYENCETIHLLQKPIKTSLPFEQLVTKRRSLRNTMKYDMSLKDITFLLENSVSITDRTVNVEKNKIYHRRATPSGGGLYPIETFIIPLTISNLILDVYHYNVFDHTLERLGKQMSFEKIGHVFFDIETVITSSVIFVLVAKFRRSAIKYGERSYRLILIEAGAILEHVALAAEAIGLRSVMLGGYIDTSLNDILGCNGVEESVVICGAVGKEREN